MKLQLIKTLPKNVHRKYSFRVIVKGRVERTRKIQHGRDKTLTVHTSFSRAQVNFLS